MPPTDIPVLGVDCAADKNFQYESLVSEKTKKRLHMRRRRGADPYTRTQVQFSRDGNYLYTGARRDTDIFCWDIRYTSDVVYRLQRDSADTNQRIQFDIEPLGRHLATGTHCPSFTVPHTSPVLL